MKIQVDLEFQTLLEQKLWPFLVSSFNTLTSRLDSLRNALFISSKMDTKWLCSQAFQLTILFFFESESCFFLAEGQARASLGFVPQEQEEVIRSSIKKIDQMIKQLEESYAVRDKQDVLAMCSLQYATKLIQRNNLNNIKDHENLKKLSNINELIKEHIANFL